MLIKRLGVWPLYAQIALFDPEEREVPAFKTGKEAVVSTPTWITVATRDDHDGPIPVEVWRGRMDVDDPGMSSAVFDGVLKLKGPTALVGSPIMNDLEPVPFGPGTHRVRVYVSPSDGRPERVYFLVD